jgi:hypothetical protein
MNYHCKSGNHCKRCSENKDFRKKILKIAKLNICPRNIELNQKEIIIEKIKEKQKEICKHMNKTGRFSGCGCLGEIIDCSSKELLKELNVEKWENHEKKCTRKYCRFFKTKEQI